MCNLTVGNCVLNVLTSDSLGGKSYNIQHGDQKISSREKNIEMENTTCFFSEVHNLNY